MRQNESVLRKANTRFGTELLLADGEYWLFSPMPLDGPLAEDFEKIGQAFEDQFLAVQDIENDMKHVTTRYSKLMQDESDVEKQLALQTEMRDKLRDLRKKNSAADRAFTRAGLDMAFLALRLNYPNIDRDTDFAGLVRAPHFAHIWRIVNGSGPMAELYRPTAENGADPPTG